MARLFVDPNDSRTWFVDWGNESGLTSVKNQCMTYQGYRTACGSCWSFTGTALSETANFRATGDLISLSSQHPLDFAGHTPECPIFCYEHSNGCGGGYIHHALEFIRRCGSHPELSYPYLGYVDPLIMYFRNPVGWIYPISGFGFAEPNNELALTHLVRVIPVGVSMRVDDDFFDLRLTNDVIYTRDVLEVEVEEDEEIPYSEHAVTIVGFGVEEGIPYWRIKNSWGTHWGCGGFLRVPRNIGREEGFCGLARMPVYPIVPVL